MSAPAATLAAAQPMPQPAVQSASRRSWMEMVMGLPVSVTVRGPEARRDRAEQVVAALYADLRHADRVFSTYRPDSEISLMRSGALPRELASPEVREVLDLCAQARTLTGGLFDAELPQPGGRRLLDPSGLVKGWAVERAARALDRLDGHDWLVNAGGDVLGCSASCRCAQAPSRRRAPRPAAGTSPTPAPAGPRSTICSPRQSSDRR